jgi:hypothetical protein
MKRAPRDQRRGPRTFKPQSYRQREQAAPCCGVTIRTAACVTADAAPPEDGDCSVCLECGAWLRFADGLQLRAFTAEDFLEVEDAVLTVLRRGTAVITRGNRAARRGGR